MDEKAEVEVIHPADRVLIAAAIKELGDFRAAVDESEDLSYTIACRVVMALAAAEEARELEMARISEKHGLSVAAYVATADTATASAVHLWLTGYKPRDIDEAFAESIGSQILQGFARGIVAAQHMYRAMDMLNNPLYNSAEGATELRESRMFPRPDASAPPHTAAAQPGTAAG